jgi:hypothetical protein
MQFDGDRLRRLVARAPLTTKLFTLPERKLVTT